MDLTPSQIIESRRLANYDDDNSQDSQNEDSSDSEKIEEGTCSKKHIANPRFRPFANVLDDLVQSHHVHENIKPVIWLGLSNDSKKALALTSDSKHECDILQVDLVTQERTFKETI